MKKILKLAVHISILLSALPVVKLCVQVVGKTTRQSFYLDSKTARLSRFTGKVISLSTNLEIARSGTVIFSLQTLQRNDPYGHP